MNFLRYFAVGGIASCVDWGLFWLFAVRMEWPYLWVAAGSFVIATLVNYALSVRFVFVSGARFEKAAEVTAVFGASAVGLSLNQLLLYASQQFTTSSLMAGKIGATACVLLWNYSIRRFYIFKAAASSATATYRP